jgi:hypothetical protein
MRPALPLLAIVILAGCSTPSSKGPTPDQTALPWTVNDLDDLDVPVMFVNGTAQYNGNEDLSRFFHIEDDRNDTEPFLLDAPNRTVWFRYPDAIWQGCGMAGVILVSQEWHSPLSDWREWRAYFQPQSGRTLLQIGSAPAFGRVSEQLASVKLETAARNGDVVTVVAGQPGKHWDIQENRSETGRLGPSNYERIDLRFQNHVEFQHGGQWKIRLAQDIKENFSDTELLARYWRATEYDESPYCHSG